MKKYISFAAALAIVGAVSCNKEIVETTPEVSESKLATLTATIGEPGTKTTLDNPSSDADKTTKTFWCADDELSVFDGTSNVQYAIKDKQSYVASNEATFEGTELAEAEAYYALYPYTETATLAEGVIKGAVLPATQTVVSGNIPEGAALAVARTTDRSTINFKNVATTIGFTLGEAATKVEFVAKGGENIAGTIDITYNGTDAPTYTVQEGKGSSKITLTDLAAGTYYFTILPDVTLSQGYELKINDYVVKTGAVGTKLERSKIYSLGEVKRNVCEWGLVGQHQGWDLTEANITRLYEVVGVNNLWVVKGLKLSSTGFKFTELDNINWNLTFGVHSPDYIYDSGWYTGIYSNNRDNKVNDIKVSDWDKTYDIYLRYVQIGNWGKELGFAIVETGSAYPSF